MSDYITPNTGTGGSSSKGLVIALVVIVLFIAGLALIGSNSAPPPDGEAAPAASDASPAEPAATGTAAD